jgi:hypothetical protein
LWIANNQQITVINFHQDFVTITHSDFFQGKTDRGLFYWPDHSGETMLSNQEDEQEELLSFKEGL